jgi:hypothetical protein
MQSAQAMYIQAQKEVSCRFTVSYSKLFFTSSEEVLLPDI